MSSEGRGKGRVRNEKKKYTVGGRESTQMYYL